MTGYLWAVLGILIGLAMTALGDMASEEIRDRLDHLPHAILRLAARQLDPGQRITIYQDEWLPELTYILKGAGARPITRLIAGTRYALGILVSARQIARHVRRRPAETPSTRSLTVPETVSRLSSEHEAGSPGPLPLTAAELRILRLLPTKLSYTEVGAELYVSVNTVKLHAASIYRKLGVSSRSQAISRSHDLGLL
jgi:DNA-binding CsgD family transcriptional regulator